MGKRSTRATKFKRGSNWSLNWYETDPATGDRERFRLSLGQITEREAEIARQHKSLELIQNANAPQNLTPTFSEFLPRYLDWHSANYPASHDRVSQITRDHLTVFYDSPLDSIPVELAEGWKAGRMLQASSGTVQKETRTLKAVLNKAVEWGIIDKSPLLALKPPRSLNQKTPSFFTVHQLQALYESAGPGEYRYVWQFMANTGLRRAEGMKAHRQHIKFESMIEIESTTEARTKSGKVRVVPLSAGALESLEHLGNGYLFPRINKRSLSRAFDRDAKRAELPTGIHQLRHTFASHLVMNGVPLRTVQILMGHSSITVTEKYAHLAPDHLHEQVAALAL